MAFYCSISNVSPMLLLRELIETVEQNTQLRKQLSALTAQNQQQVSPETCLKTVRPSQLGQLLNPASLVFVLEESNIVDLEQNLKSGDETIKGLEQKIEQDKVSLKRPIRACSLCL